MKKRPGQLRLVFVIGSARRGGAEHQLVRLARHLSSRGVDVRVLFQVEGGPLTAELDSAGVRWEVLRPRAFPPTTLGRNVMIPLRLGFRLLRWQPDIVFAWLPSAIWMALPIATVSTRARRIAAFRGEVAEMRSFAKTFAWAVSRAHAVTVNAPQLLDVAVRWGASADRVVFIPNGVNVPVSAALVHEQPPIAVVVANFRHVKGHDLLIDALVHVDEPLIVRLVGAGDGRKQLSAYAVQRGVSERLHFVEQPADVLAELKSAQFAIHPSRTEGLPNAILEELAAGLPVVATAVGGVPLLVEDEVNGFLVPLGEERLLAKRISELASCPDLRVSMARESKSRAAKFSWDASVAAYLQLFSDVMRAVRQ